MRIRRFYIAHRPGVIYSSLGDFYFNEGWHGIIPKVQIAFDCIEITWLYLSYSYQRI